MTSLRRRVVAVAAVVGSAALLPGLVILGPAQASPSALVDADSVRIVAQFPVSLAGAVVQVTRDAGTRTLAATETLHSGVLAGSGLLSVEVPRETLLADNGGAFVQVIAALPIPGTKTALQSIASLGMTGESLAETPLMTLTPPAPEVVPTYSFAEAAAVTGGGGRTADPTPTAADIAQMQAGTEAQPVEHPAEPAQALPERGRAAQGTEALPAGEDTAAADPGSTSSTDGASGATSAEDVLAQPADPSRARQNGPDVALATAPLQVREVSMDSVTDAQDIYGVYTFRSWSTQGYGMRAQFAMSSTAETITQNGIRTEAGAFAVNGTTGLSKQSSTSSSTTDTWPMRSDCWRDSSTGVTVQGDGPDCTNLFYGFIGAYGHDTWRWERHVSTNCSAGWVCFNTIYETLRNRYYIGGTFNDEFVGMTDYEKRPSAVRAGSFGNWTGYEPDSTRQSDFNQSFTRSRGVTVGVKATWGTTFGSATFESTTSQRNERLATMNYSLRRLVYVGGTDNFVYKFWYYDVTGAMQFDHFSCELNPGWVSKGACWNYGS
ncbi:MAG: hypothetical protein ACJ71Y_03960 [Blastococcus sp.]